MATYGQVLEERFGELASFLVVGRPNLKFALGLNTESRFSSSFSDILLKTLSWF